MTFLTLIFAAVTLTPGSNVPDIVSASPAGTTFQFSAGVYRLAKPIVPKQGDVFVGAANLQSVIRGSVVVTGWTQQGTVWVASMPYHYSNPTCTTNCTCDTDHPACNLSEDAFFDATLKQRMVTVSQVTAGKWCWDKTAGKLYVGDNPAGHVVEVSVVSRAFAGASSNVTIDGLLMERFGGQVVYPRVDGGQFSNGWIVRNSTVRYGHLAGITLTNAMQVLNSVVCDNGKLGLAAGGTGSTLDGVEICRNNYAGFISNRGGSKFDGAANLTIKNCYVHDNLGAGLHTDSGSINVIFDRNHTARNMSAGIDHEISHSAIISNNLVESDAFSPLGTSVARGAGIWVFASDNVEVYGNTVTNSMNGIAAVQTMRNDSLGDHYLKNLNVHDNSITQPSGTAAGIYSNKDYHYYPAVFTQWGNKWVHNTYCLSNPTGPFYLWNLTSIAKAVWQSTYQQDVAGVWTCPAPTKGESNK